MDLTWRTLALERPIVEAIHSGELRYEDAKELRDTGMRMCLEEGTYLFLLDMTATTDQPPAALIVEIANSLAAAGLTALLREAVVEPRDATAAVWADLFVAAAVNRGLAVSLHRDRDSAIAWLLA